VAASERGCNPESLTVKRFLPTLPDSHSLPLFLTRSSALTGKEFYAFPQEEKFIDIGTPISYKEAETFFMKNGGGSACTNCQGSAYPN